MGAAGHFSSSSRFLRRHSSSILYIGQFCSIVLASLVKPHRKSRVFVPHTHSGSRGSAHTRNHSSRALAICGVGRMRHCRFARESLPPESHLTPPAIRTSLMPGGRLAPLASPNERTRESDTAAHSSAQQHLAPAPAGIVSAMSSERPSTAGGPAKSNATANANTEMPSGKAQRVLACVLCQHRKVKCSRSFPCSNCTKVGVQCVPGAMIPRQRKRRFPEKELLGRIRHYEALLCEHGVDFEPLHGSHGRNAPVPGNPNKRQGEGSSLEPDNLSSFSLAGGSGSSPSATSKSDGTYEPK